MASPYILVVDDEPDIRDLVKEILEDEGFEVAVAADAHTARESRRARRPDLILLDIWMPDTDGISLLKEWSADIGQNTSVVMMSGHGNVETAVEATRHGAFDFIEKPLSMVKLLVTVRRALEASQLKQENQDSHLNVLEVAEPVGRSPCMVQLRDQIKRIAQHDTPVFLHGESGSGKEVFARYLHRHSQRHDKPFVRISVGGLTDVNFATELFGAEIGGQIHYGLLEQANGGTLFFEDVIELEADLQGRLLGALQDRSFFRIDGTEPIQTSFRVVAATKHDAARSVEAGVFRKDLYYLLNVVPVEIPPLRAHREDIPELLDYYVDQLSSRGQLPYRHFSVSAQNRLRNYSWPGNILELKNLVQRLLILGDGDEIDQAAVESATGEQPRVIGGASPTGFDLPLKEAREQFERAYFEHLLRQMGGNISRVAHQSGIERTHLYRKLRALGIDAKQVNAERD